MQNLYPNLPAILTEFKDGGLALRNDPNPPATESILILGTAIDGPILEPVAVDAETAEKLFGRSINPNGTPNGATLVQAFEEAYAAGCRDIRLMRVTGQSATAKLEGASATFSHDKAKQEVLGLAAGNTATTFTLNQEVIDISTVLVKIDGSALTSGQIVITNGSAGTKATVQAKAGVGNVGAKAFITYTYNNGTADVTVTENAFIPATGPSVFYELAGVDQVITLAEAPKVGSLHLYADGSELASTNFTVNAATKEITVKAGAAEQGARLEVSYLFTETVTETPEIKLESVFGGFLYNDLKVEVRNIVNGSGTIVGKEVVITKPASKKAQIVEQPLRFSSIDYPTFGLLVSAINNSAANNVVKAQASRHLNALQVETLNVTPETNFTGGDNGVDATKQELFEALGGRRDINGNIVEEGAYQWLENYKVDMVIPVGVNFDDELAGKYDNFGYQLALACAVMSHRTSATMGIITTTTPDEAGIRAVAQHVDYLESLEVDLAMRDKDGNKILDSEGKEMDLGRYITILAGPDAILASARSGLYGNNSPTAVGGFVSTLKAQSAPTNKELPFARGLRYTYSNSQLDRLTAKRFVTLRDKRNGQAVAITDAMTAAKATSDYARLATYRVVKEAVNEVRDVCEPYIGEPNEEAQRNAMSSAIDKRLSKMKEAGALRDFQFTVVSTLQMQLLGQSQIELTIVPPMELREITVVVAVAPTL